VSGVEQLCLWVIGSELKKNFKAWKQAIAHRALLVEKKVQIAALLHCPKSSLENI
jgi:hypothetical protein